MNVNIRLANSEDKISLKKMFAHYKNSNLIKKRVDCYLNHNDTVIAVDKDSNELIGMLQFYLKENPNDGLFELE